MHKLFIKLAFIVLLFQGNLFSQNTPTKIIDEFFERYEKEGITIALDSLYATNKWVTNSPGLVIQLKSKIKMALGNEDFIGEMHGYEPISVKTLGSSFKLYSYLVKYDRQPIRFTFKFYKPQDDWILYTFKYDFNIPEEIEEAAKLYYEINGY